MKFFKPEDFRGESFNGGHLTIETAVEMSNAKLEREGQKVFEVMRKKIRFPMCSFCGKGKRLAGLIITSEKACICDECIAICAEIVAQDKLKNQKEQENE